MSKILVTGGCGYIGSHTLVDLLQNGFDVISIDNNSRSNQAMLIGVRQIAGKEVKNYKVDLCDYDDLSAVFMENPDITGIIHFAAYKAVGESVEHPIRYYENNLVSLINILKCAEEFHVAHFIFSSSCTVYGNPDHIPVTESSPIKPAESPYGATKQIGERIVEDLSHVSKMQSVLLRYFNPVGAHPSALIGELPIGKPANLVPAITQTAIGKLKELVIHGDDYNTRDGSCIRDYIHVADVAAAHTLALKYLIDGRNASNISVFNLGTGNGVSVLEAVKAFEKVSGKKLNYRIGPRRPGDVIAVYADNTLVRKELGWNPVYSLDEMMASAWKWEQKLAEDESFYGNANFLMN